MSEYESYRTLKKASSGLFKDRGSKHYSFAFPVRNLEEIKSHLQELRNEHGDANHVCYGYRLTGKEIREYCSDDGEPSNSAGAPILGQLKSQELENVLVAVVRYFGGSKLGVPGLINAYRTAAQLALENGEVVEQLPVQLISIQFAYSLEGEVSRLIRQHHLTVVKKEYTDVGRLVLEIKKLELASILSKFDQITDLKWEALNH